jgi:hypothetical protein
MYIVLCHYEGCEDCHGGSHILGVFDDEILARFEMSVHNANMKIHNGHFHYTDFVTCELNKALG